MKETPEPDPRSQSVPEVPRTRFIQEGSPKIPLYRIWWGREWERLSNIQGSSRDESGFGVGTLDLLALTPTRCQVRIVEPELRRGDAIGGYDRAYFISLEMRNGRKKEIVVIWGRGSDPGRWDVSYVETSS